MASASIKRRCQLETGDGDPVRNLCKTLEITIKEETGYEVQILHKEHHYFRTLVATLDTKVPTNVHFILGREGNCIPMAIASLQETFAVAVARLELETSDAKKVRTYREVSLKLGVFLNPHLSLPREPKGNWLIHMENGGSPHCMGLRFENDGTTVVFHEGACVFTATRKDLDSFISVCVWMRIPWYSLRLRMRD